MKRFIIGAALVAVVAAAGAGGYRYWSHRNQTPADYLRSGQTYMDRNQYGRAEIQFRNVLNKDPNNAQAHLLLVKLYLKGKLPNAAEPELILAARAGAPDEQLAPLRAQAFYDQGKVGDVLKNVPPGNRKPQYESAVRAYRGLSEIVLGDMAAAEADLQKAISLDSSAAAPHVGLARLRVLQQRTREAETIIDAALKQNPEDSEALDLKGVLLLARGSADEGLAALNKAVTNDPRNFRAMLDRADAYLRRNQLDKAEADIKKILGVTDNSGGANYLNAVILTRRGRYQDADETMMRLRPMMEQVPETYFLAGAIKYNLGQLEQAETFIERFLAKRPNSPKAYELLGSIALRRGDAPAAVEALRRALALSPNDTTTIALMSEAYMANGDFASGVALLDQSLTHTSDKRLKVQRAIGDLRMGNYNQSLAELQEIFQKGQGDKVSGPPLVLAALSAGDLKTAAATAEQLVQQDPKSVFSQQLLGMVRVAQSNIPAAESIFKGILQKAPAMQAARTSLARIYLSTNRAPEAIKLFRDRLTQVPGDFASAQALAAIYANNKNFGQAIEVLRAAQESNADDPSPSLAIMTLYLQQKQTAKAIQLGNSLTNQYPKSEAAYVGLAAAYAASGSPADSARIYQAGTVALPKSARLWELSFQAQTSLNNKQGALDAITKAQALDPANARYRNELVNTVYDLKGADAAMAAIADVTKGNANDPTAALMSSDILVRQNKRDAAIAVLQKELAVRPSNLVVARLCGLYQEAGDYQKAAAVASGWLANHDDFTIRLLLADYQRLLGKLDAAQASYEQLLKQRPTDVVALNNLAWVYLRRNDPRALDTAHRAYKAAPDMSSVADTLGWVMVNRNQVAEGMKYLDAALAAEPNDPSLQYHKAFALAASGRAADARALAQKALGSKDPFEERADATALVARLGKAGK